MQCIKVVLHPSRTFYEEVGQHKIPGLPMEIIF